MLARAIILTVGLSALTIASAGAAVIGDDGPNVLQGTAGRDALYGRGGADRLLGAAGDDDLDGGAGSDDLAGGAGDDAASYGGRTSGVTVSLDDRADDGELGERDNVHRDVEAVYGGSGPDVLVGNRSANTLDGGAGADRIIGGRDADGLYGGSGADFVDAADGRVDTVDCGPGKDRARIDANDIVRHCEDDGSRDVVVFRIDKGIDPVGVPRAQGCRGRLRLVVHDNKRTLARATVRLRRNCRYGKRFRIVRSKVRDARRLDLTVRFLGNAVLGATTFRFPNSLRVPPPD